MQIITGVERRRRWPPELKLQIIAESLKPGASVSEIARRLDVCRGLLWNWRSQARRKARAQQPAESFVPVKLIDSPPPQSPETPATGRIEIALPHGICVRIAGEVSSERRVITALRE
jgi:transposase-like protein